MGAAVRKPQKRQQKFPPRPLPSLFAACKLLEPELCTIAELATLHQEIFGWIKQAVDNGLRTIPLYEVSSECWAMGRAEVQGRAASARAARSRLVGRAVSSVALIWELWLLTDLTCSPSPLVVACAVPAGPLGKPCGSPPHLVYELFQLV